jgi:hypothetical protein
MKRFLLLMAPLAALVWSASAQTTTAIPILNSQFDMNVLSCSPGNLCYAPSAGITGWQFGPETNVQKMSTVQYPDAPAAGLYVATLGYSYATGSILQTLGDAVQANTTYILKIKVGARADYPFTGYTASLLAGNVPLASSNRATPVGGTFVTDVIIYNSGANPAQLGKPLQILVMSTGTGQTNVQSVSLTAVTQ